MTELTAVARAMTDPIWLTPDELHQLTGRKRWSARRARWRLRRSRFG